METPYPIGTGIYLVIDPSMDKPILYNKLDAALQAGVAAVQIWDHFRTGEDIPTLIGELCRRCHDHGIPVLINNQWRYLVDTPLDGVHFDAIPTGYGEIQAAVGRPFRCGITCMNDMEPVRWAHDHKADYISFCSMFPSGTVGSCELVTHDSVRRAAAIYEGPIFLAGGITPDNVGALSNLHHSGIAVISGVMGSGSPGEAIRAYQKQMH